MADMSAPGDRIPALVRDIEASGSLPAIAAVDDAGRRVDRAWLLVRIFTEPLGFVVLDVPGEGLAPTDLARAIAGAYGDQIGSRVTAADRARAKGGTVDESLPVDAEVVSVPPPFLARRAEVLRAAVPITVVVCTRERPVPLARCLESLLAQAYPSFRVLVVDNAPESDATERVVAAAAARGRVEYLLAHLPGLSRARNAAVAAAPGEILAWIDDDEVADPYWLSEVARALADRPDADVVSGVVVPAELETPAQEWFEQFGGHSKGRGFTPAVFSPATAAQQSPLYPLPPFGTGANMVFRPGVIESIGGFDPALGAGTPAMGSEDTLAFTQVLRRGGTIAYQPTAVVRHYHRRDIEGLRRQMVGYGTGLTAAYTSLIMRNPLVLLELVRLLPTALRDMFGHGGLRTATIMDDFPRELLGANRRGMLRGPLASIAGRRQHRRLNRRSVTS
jgi:GT2 family glycosyltransferase